MQTKLTPLLTPEAGDTHFARLQNELRRAGLFRATKFETGLRFLLLSLLMVLSLSIAWDPAGDTGRILIGNVLLALVMAQFAFLGHDSAHGALFQDKTATLLMGEFCMTIITGLCYQEWKDRHVSHHEHCQQGAIDPDMQPSVVSSVTKECAEKKTGLARRLVRFQGFTLWPISLLFGLSQRFLGQAGALAAPRTYKSDMVALFIHYVLWMIFPLFVLKLSWGVVLAAYLLPPTLIGPYFAAIFWVNHVGMPTVDDPGKFSFFEHQVRTTRTVEPLPGVAWVFGGLCYQIEHHLFPSIPSYRLGKATSFTKRAVEEAKMDYFESSWTKAIVDVGRHFHRVSRL